MQTPDFSVSNFILFLKELGVKDAMNPSTAQNLRGNALRLLAFLEDDVSSDVRNINIDDLIGRLASSVTPIPSQLSLNAYKTRMNSAVKKFLITQENLKKEQSNKTTTIRNDNEEKHPAMKEEHPTAREHKLFSLPILLRPESGHVVMVTDLPMELTQEEYERITGVLKMYVK